MNLKCRTCGKIYNTNNKIWQCKCGGLLDLIETTRFNPDQINSTLFSIWRYAAFLPVKNASIISFGEGITPIIKEDDNLFFKLDYIFPTGSFKDRGASVLISKMNQLGISEAVEDSSGNAGKAIAAYCSKAGIHCQIVVPENTSENKITAIRTTEAEINIVDGSRRLAAKIALDLAKKTYYASHVWNPFFLQGTKTIAYELFEQFDRMPERIIVPVGNGTLILGLFIGLIDLASAGLLDNFPEIVGVQSVSCAPLVEIYNDRHSEKVTWDCSETIAKGISVEQPARGAQILDLIDKYNGQMVKVDEDEISRAYKKLQKKGYLIEPTSAVAFAACKKYFSDKIATLVILTGSN